MSLSSLNQQQHNLTNLTANGNNNPHHLTNHPALQQQTHHQHNYNNNGMFKNQLFHFYIIFYINEYN